MVYFGFIAGKGPTRGLLHVWAADGLNVRMAMLVAAGWLTLFALPLLLTANRLPQVPGAARPARGLLGGYRKLWTELVAEWHRDRNLVYFLLAAAVFRDGLAGLFTFGGVLGVNVYGISPADVLIFGVAASVVAALGAVLGGLIDDRVGSKSVIVVSLVSIIVAGLTMMVLSGPGGVLALRAAVVHVYRAGSGVGADVAAEDGHHGKEGVAFGLYTMTGGRSRS